MHAENTKTFEVVKPLSVRIEPSLSSPRRDEGLWPETIVEVNADSSREVDGFIWWQHDQGWSAERSLDGENVFMKPQTAQAPPTDDEKTYFEALIQLSIRTEPRAAAARLPNTFLTTGEVIEVVSGSRREVDGFVWWQHDRGWSAERKADGTVKYMQPASAPPVVEEPVKPEPEAPETPVAEEPETPEPEAPETPEPETPEPPTEEKRFRVAKTLSIRNRPSLSGKQSPNLLTVGTIIDVDPESRTEADGFVWWKHSRGWSAEKKTDGSLVLMVEPGTTITTTAPPQDGPIDVNTLPQRGTLFQRMPVALNLTAWIQYYGNTDFAYENGSRWGYNSYAQGLHSGFDFGNSNYGQVPQLRVFAGVSGTFIDNNRYGVRVQAGEYIVIYQHLTQTHSYNKGGTVTPDTLIGLADPSYGSNRHLHLEVRYQGDTYIVNPLLFFPLEDLNTITMRWSNYPSHFSNMNGFNLWQSPLDQPVIKVGGPMIGPKA